MDKEDLSLLNGIIYQSKQSIKMASEQERLFSVTDCASSVFGPNNVKLQNIYTVFDVKIFVKGRSKYTNATSSSPTVKSWIL